MPAFAIEHLDESSLADAWPLLRWVGAAPVPEWWETEARALIERGGGVLAARAPDGLLHGIATYECVRRVRAGSVLTVHRLVTFELKQDEPAKHALCGAIFRIAAAFRCSASRFLCRRGDMCGSARRKSTRAGRSRTANSFSGARYSGDRAARASPSK